MMTVTDHIRAHLLKSLGFSVARKVPDLPALRATEWNPDFEKLMRNRLIMGAFRYGTKAEKDGLNIRYDYAKAIKPRLELYLETGDIELLVDVANLALLEFQHGKHPKKHFGSVGEAHTVHTVSTNNPNALH